MKKVATKRTFDLDLKLDLVKQIESGKVGVSQVSRIYQVSPAAIYKWLRKYSDLYKNQTRVVVEKKSISNKNKELQQRIAELERALGQKQMRIDYLEQVVDVASSELGVDIEKKSKRRS
ncbi:transposase [Robertkochia aurantiaca]|uniref:transposase n=1 Tax=Robertkochia aurantiaca TaxID=2873700 RepID=UPI001CCBF85D|nr:transposase [Robertkochia sp. 3YJGBD-33]